MNLTGGYYDAVDNMKFNFPMAFTTTMISWAITEFGNHIPPNNLATAFVAVRQATDYLLNSVVAILGKLYIRVGDPNADHQCWERPEDMDTPRIVYFVSLEKPGSNVAGETVAALSAVTLVFRVADKKFSTMLLSVAKKVILE